MNEDKAKLLDNLEAWKNCPSTRCEDCEFSDPFAVKRTCTAMDAMELIELTIKVIKNDMDNLREKDATIKSLVDTVSYHNCNNCWNNNCGYKPDAGDKVRSNCICWQGKPVEFE